MYSEWKKPLLYFTVSSFAFIVGSIATAKAALLDISDISFSFGQGTPLVLEWTEFTQGYKLRVENTSKNGIKLERIAARVKPSDGFSKSILEMIQIAKQEPCKMTPDRSPTSAYDLENMLRSKKICSYLIADLMQLQPRSSNSIEIKRSTNQFELPTRPIKFVLTLNETKYVSASRVIIIKPPAIQTDTDERTIKIDTFKLLDLDFTQMVGLLQSDFFTLDSIKKLCGKSNILQNNCIAGNAFSTYLGEFNPSNYEPLIFQGTNSNLYAKIAWNEGNTGLILDFKDNKNIFSEGDYKATSARFLGTDPSKPVNLKLEVRSHWIIVSILILAGLFLAFASRILQGSPIESLLYRVDKAKLNFIDSAVALQFESSHNIKKAVYLRAWQLTLEIQKLRLQNAGIVTASTTGFSALDDKIKKYENLPSQWEEFILNLKAIEKINIASIKVPSGLLAKSFVMSTWKSDLAKISIDSKKLSLQDTEISDFFEKTLEAKFEAAKQLAEAKGIAPKLGLIKKWWVTILILILSSILTLLIFSQANINLQNPLLASILIGAAIFILMTWLWTRFFWIIQWYWMIFILFLARKSHPNQLSVININWWDTLPIFIALLVALVNGMSEFYLKISLTPLFLQQLSLIAWGFGSTAAVQALFAVLEKSPLGRYF